MSAEADALEMQAKELGSLLRELSEDDWEQPTRCPPLSVREMVGHVGSVLHRFAETLGQDFDGAAEYDRSSYYAVFRDEVAPMVVEESQEMARERSGEAMLEWFVEGAEAAVTVARTTPEDKIVGTRRFPRRLRALEFTATRVLETAVHAMDIGHATLKGERIHPDAVPIVTGILDGLLQAELPKGLGWDARTYILTGTGRRRLEPNERFVLGPLAGKFPLLS